MGPRRRRWRRSAAKAALAALGLALLGMLGSGGGEELLAAALAAWGERGGEWGDGGDGGEWGMGGGEAGAASWGGGFLNGDWAGFVNGGRGNGAGLTEWGAGFLNEGAGGGKGGWGVLNGSSGVTNGGPGGGFGGLGGVTGGPAAPSGGPPVPPGCFGLLSGGSGDLHEGPSAPPRSPPTPRLLLAPPPCAPPAPFLLLLVPSAPPHRERRSAVRDTWGGLWENSGTPPARTVFVLGAAPSPAAQRQVLAESRRHGDILQGDFGDTYARLAVKTLLLLRWARACCEAAPFLLKADDDVFVNVPAVATYLATWPAAPPRLYLGRVHWGVSPNRDPRSRHHVPAALFPGRRFPPYCSGTAYVLSRQAATAVLRAAGRVPLALPEDVWVGVGARRAGVSPRHSRRFGGSWRFPPERCCLGRALLSAHRVRPREMRAVWAELRQRPAGCAGMGGAVGVLRCRGMALGAWLRGDGGGSDGMDGE